MALLGLLLDAYSLVVLVSVIGSWVGSDNEVFRLADRLTEPLLGPIRKLLPPAGGIDFSPMILLIGLQLLRRLLFH